MGAQQSDQNGLGGFCCNNSLCNNDNNIDNKSGMGGLNSEAGLRKSNYRRAAHNSNSSVQKQQINQNSFN